MLTKSRIDEVPNAFKEYVLAQDFGWSLEYIRNIEEKDKDSLFALCVTKLMYRNFDTINMMALTSTGKSLV